MSNDFDFQVCSDKGMVLTHIEVIRRYPESADRALKKFAANIRQLEADNEELRHLLGQMVCCKHCCGEEGAAKLLERRRQLLAPEDG